MNVFLSASTVDYYKVDKEDIVVADTPETAPPALPPTAQTLPSQPLDVVFIERRGKLEVNTFLSLITSNNYSIHTHRLTGSTKQLMHNIFLFTCSLYIILEKIIMP